MQAEDFEAADTHSAELDAAQQSAASLQQDVRRCEDELAALVRSHRVLCHLPQTYNPPAACSCRCCMPSTPARGSKLSAAQVACKGRECRCVGSLAVTA